MPARRPSFAWPRASWSGRRRSPSAFELEVPHLFFSTCCTAELELVLLRLSSLAPRSLSSRSVASFAAGRLSFCERVARQPRLGCRDGRTLGGETFVISCRRRCSTLRCRRSVGNRLSRHEPAASLPAASSSCRSHPIADDIAAVSSKGRCSDTDMELSTMRRILAKRSREPLRNRAFQPIGAVQRHRTRGKAAT